MTLLSMNDNNDCQQQCQVRGQNQIIQSFIATNYFNVKSSATGSQDPSQYQLNSLLYDRINVV